MIYTHIYKLDILFLCKQFERKWSHFPWTIFLHLMFKVFWHHVNLLNWTWFAPPNYTLKVWVGLDFFFQIFKWFQSSGNNFISRKRKHDFHLQRHCPMWIYLASMIWRGCVRGRKINPPFPIVLTSLFICNLYMNPITFNYPFFLLLPPFWF